MVSLNLKNKSMKIKIQIISDDGERMFTHKEGVLPEELVK